MQVVLINYYLIFKKTLLCILIIEDYFAEHNITLHQIIRNDPYK